MRRLLFVALLLCNSAVGGEPEKAAAKLLESLKFSAPIPDTKFGYGDDEKTPELFTPEKSTHFAATPGKVRLYQFPSGDLGVIVRYKVKLSDKEKEWSHEKNWVVFKHDEWVPVQCQMGWYWFDGQLEIVSTNDNARILTWPSRFAFRGFPAREFLVDVIFANRGTKVEVDEDRD